MKQFDMNWKSINILISEILNNKIFLSEKNLKIVGEFSGLLKRRNTIIVLISAASLIPSASFHALPLSYQNETRAKDEVALYTVTLGLNLSFPNTSVLYDPNRIYWHQ